MTIRYGVLLTLYLFASAASALTITNINPGSGIATGGNTVTITGTDLANVNNVDFGGYIATIQSQNSTQVVVTVPDAQTWGAVDVQVDDNNDSKIQTNGYTYLTPTITSVSPTEGPMSGGTSVTITGNNFTNDLSAVYFGGNNATSFTWINSTEISAITSDSGGIAGLASVDFDVNAGTVYGPNQFTYLAPSISGISPSQGPVSGGNSVTITGSNFSDIVDVQFGGNSATSFIVVDTSTITAIVQDSEGITGLVNVDVIDTNFNTYTLQNAYTFLSPSIINVLPNQGPVSGGNTVTIQGSNFSGITDIQFNWQSATSFSVVDTNTITATVPDSSGTAGLVSVGIDTSSNTYTFNNAYTYLAPGINDISPAIGPAAGGTSVTINGSNFAGITDVQFNWQSATSFTVVDTNTITAVTPDSGGTTGLVTVSLDTTSNTYTFPNAFTYAAITVNSISPNQGPESGGTSVTISGSAFAGITDVQFNWVSATSFAVVDANTITAVTPDSGGTTGTVEITIDTLSNSYSFPNAFTYIAAPSIISISPNSGNTYGGVPITITASNLVNGATATINGIPLTGTTTATTITGTTPALPVGTYAVVVTNPDGQIDTRTNGFTVSLSPAPTLTSINPNTVDARGGITATLTGNNFVAGTTTTINGTALTGVSVDNATTITAIIPPLTEGVHDLVVTTPDGQTAILNNAFTVTPSPEFIAGDLAPRGAPDGQLNVGDLVVMHRFISELETPTAKELLIADVAPLSGPDNQLNVADALLLQRALLGEITLSNVIDNQPPQISIISPATNSYTTANTIAIIGMLDEPGTLTINGTTVTVDAFFTFTHNINLLEGVNNITLVATDIYGNSQPQTLTINKDTKAPAAVDANRLTLSESTGQVTITGTAGSVEAGATVSITANGSTITTLANANGSFSALINATSGDQVQITVVDSASNNSNSLSYSVGATLQIISPQASSTINAETINVVGVFADENNSGINVNGETACTYNNNFYVNNLLLTSGTNTLTATYTTESGDTDSTSINVTQSGTASYKLSADQNCGIAPLNVSFDFDAGNNTIQQLDIDYDNDGVIDLTTTTPATATLQHNYTTAGVYPVTAWVTTATTVQQLSLNIVINDVTQENDTLQAVWNGMMTALIAGDKATALSFINSDSRKTYDPLFDALMPNIAAIRNRMSAISRVDIGSNIASYAILKNGSGQNKIYMIDFIKGGDGVWRLDSM